MDEGGGELATESTNSNEEGSATRLIVLVESLLKGELFVTEVARTHGLKVAAAEDWRE